MNAITVADVVAHLRTLPQDAEVWRVWDESGECCPRLVVELTAIPTTLVRRRNYASGNLEWQSAWTAREERRKNVKKVVIV